MSKVTLSRAIFNIRTKATYTYIRIGAFLELTNTGYL
jgi:hypothetical protein